MSEASAQQLRAGVPTVDFYGETAEWSTAALLHCEPLIERSRLHAWRIRPHRHSSLVQLFKLQRGSGKARFDGTEAALTAPCLAIVPALCVHEFQWSNDSDGYALSVAATLFNDLEPYLGAHVEVFRRIGIIDASTALHLADLALVGTLIEQLQNEYTGHQLHREAALGALFRTLAIRIVRMAAPPGPSMLSQGSRANRHYQRFVQLLERHHREQWTVAEYAADIGVTAPHLNAICKKLNGTTAKRIVQDRLLLAARRDLTYTDRSIAGVAAGLGFSEPSYFTRFFRRQIGVTPKSFRRLSGTVSG